jgi:hypothetical protein
VRGLAFSLDGLLLSAGDDRTVKIWKSAPLSRFSSLTAELLQPGPSGSARTPRGEIPPSFFLLPINIWRRQQSQVLFVCSFFMRVCGASWCGVTVAAGAHVSREERV